MQGTEPRRVNERSAVLVVTDSIRLRDELRRALQAHGHLVVHCAGPQPPAFTCVAGLGCSCKIAREAGTIILDGELRSDDAATGTTAAELAHYYRGLGHRVVFLEDDEPLRAELPPDVTRISRHAGPVRIAAAVAGPKEHPPAIRVVASTRR